jgi:chromate transport protein ChrA
MKKQLSLFLGLSIVFLLTSSFLIEFAHSAEMLKTTQRHFGFWKAAGLGLSAYGTYALWRRRRHFGSGIGCLGIIVLVILGLIFLPLLIAAVIVIGILALFGVRFRRHEDYRSDRRGRRDRDRGRRRRNRW